MFNLGSSYFHVALTTVRHLLNDNFDNKRRYVDDDDDDDDDDMTVVVSAVRVRETAVSLRLHAVERRRAWMTDVIRR